MKSKIKLVLLPLVIGAFIFIAGSFTANSATDSNEATNSNQKDGEIIATLIVANKNEIAAAEEALNKATSPDVKEYAGMLKKEHSDNLENTLNVSNESNIDPVETEKVIELKEAGNKELSELSDLKDKSFDTAYINAMVKGHEDLLAMFDNNFLKNVSNTSLKELLLKTRPHIESHLEQAKKIQKAQNY
jgi:putative membrane protein